MFFVAVVVSCGLLVGTGVGLPAKNKWLTMSSSLGPITAGYMHHDILGRVMERAFAGWHDALPLEGSDGYRAMCRNKAWRCKCVTNDGDKRTSQMITNFASIPLDHLIMRLQWLDERGDILLDIGNDASCPIRQAQTELLDSLRRGPIGPFQPVVDHFNAEGAKGVGDKVQKSSREHVCPSLVAHVAAQDLPLSPPAFSRYSPLGTRRLRGAVSRRTMLPR